MFIWSATRYVVWLVPRAIVLAYERCRRQSTVVLSQESCPHVRYIGKVVMVRNSSRVRPMKKRNSSSRAVTSPTAIGRRTRWARPVGFRWGGSYAQIRPVGSDLCRTGDRSDVRLLTVGYIRLWYSAVFARSHGPALITLQLLPLCCTLRSFGKSWVLSH